MSTTQTNLSRISEVIKRHGLRAKKSLGQNFLLDLNLTKRIAQASGDLHGQNIVEIGAGPGGLTRALLCNGAGHVFAVERDFRAIHALKELSEAYPSRLTVIEADAMRVDLNSISPQPRKIVANLPYNIATSLLVRWLQNLDGVTSMTLMFQREVAERLAAIPGSKAYGRLSVITQWLCEVQLVFNLPKEAFTPPPKVTSTVVNLLPRNNRLAEANFKALETVTMAAFGQRRKMLRSSLKPLKLDPTVVGIDETARAEELDVHAFCALARLYIKLHP
ncbi:MAG: 16S rRNA (adenine(1518)-N(6)/adenine(1519)-N(6))-dimethyltransferase [Rhodospirillaceae bacterium TMED8]|nr:16S rRNA (adenine(1518)-N(6)/adenine(1519)-N(6))-dimethyltransferase [Magnetovibrio sp.]OUT50844.1 MAG: 16S rRNA (adenine(1518)-N(6)/adenine(1519)-N(6))-dimethyltransferase [Rhodospirillaceae bacterium TMED8]